MGAVRPLELPLECTLDFTVTVQMKVMEDSQVDFAQLTHSKFTFGNGV